MPKYIYNGVELYVVDHKVGMLISGGFGSGWSTPGWNDYPQLAYDRRVIEYWLQHKDEPKFQDALCEIRTSIFQEYSEEHKAIDDFFRSIGYEGVYYKGLSYIKELEWVDLDDAWAIEAFDGAEFLLKASEGNIDTFKHAKVIE